MSFPQKILVVAASIGVVCITAFEMFRGALDIGLGLDTYEASVLFEEGLQGTWDPQGLYGVAPESIAFTKGNAFQLLAHVANILRANEQWGDLALTAESFAVQNLLLVLLTFVTAGFTAIICFSLTDSRLFGLLGATSVLAIPLIVGHGIFNPKDVPASTGFTAFTAGLIVSLNYRFKFPAHQALGFLLIAFGTWLAVGTRFSLWPVFAALVVAITGLAFSRFGAKSEERMIKGRAFEATIPFAAMLLGFALVAITHPHYLPYWDEWLERSVTSATNHYWFGGATLTLGNLVYGTDLTWWYLPLWFFIATPILLIPFILIGVLGMPATKPKYQARSRSSWVASYGLLLTQALVLPLTGIVLGSVFYNAQRQHLYAFPALACFATLGLYLGLQYARSKLTKAQGRWASTALLMLYLTALLIPTFERQALRPYQYTYLNEFSYVTGINGVWETDVMATSLREAITRVPKSAPVRTIGPQDQLPVFAHLQGSSAGNGHFLDRDTIYEVRWTQGGNRLPESCRTVDNVLRDFRGQKVVMTWVGICGPNLESHQITGKVHSGG